jgi:hypothetical protein
MVHTVWECRQDFKGDCLWENRVRKLKFNTWLGSAVKNFAAGSGPISLYDDIRDDPAVCLRGCRWGESIDCFS